MIVRVYYESASIQVYTCPCQKLFANCVLQQSFIIAVERVGLRKSIWGYPAAPELHHYRFGRKSENLKNWRFGHPLSKPQVAKNPDIQDFSHHHRSHGTYRPEHL